MWQSLLLATESNKTSRDKCRIKTVGLYWSGFNWQSPEYLTLWYLYCIYISILRNTISPIYTKDHIGPVSKKILSPNNLKYAKDNGYQCHY